jgi:hypothetical protein
MKKLSIAVFILKQSHKLILFLIQALKSIGFVLLVIANYTKQNIGKMGALHQTTLIVG